MTPWSPKEAGWLEVICGSMFSGKTEELIRRVRRARIARQVVALFKPSRDDRYHESEVVSHQGASLSSIPVDSPLEILAHLPEGVAVVAIDEAQFFEETLLEVVQALLRRRLRVIVAGLEQDYRGEAFPVMAALMVEAEFITKSLAICVRCGNPALRNQRLKPRDGRLVPGGAELYEARCRACFEPGGDEESRDLFPGEHGP